MTPVKYDNVDLDTSGMDEYIAVYVLSGEGVQASLGVAGDYILSGVLVIMIFTELGAGSQRPRAIADAMSDLFRGTKIGDIVFKVPSGSRVAFDGSYYQFNLTIPFYSFFKI